MTRRVIYHSVTGNTRKAAREIASVLGCEAEEASGAVFQDQIDQLYIGGACYGGKLHQDLAALIRSLEPGQAAQAVLFSTGFLQTSAVDRMQALLVEAGIPVHSEVFICRGRFLLFNWGHPSREDLTKAREFALRTSKPD